MELKLYKNNKSGIKGLYFDSSKNSWRVYLWVEDRGKHFGTFKDKQLAIEQLNKVKNDYCKTIY